MGTYAAEKHLKFETTKELEQPIYVSGMEIEMKATPPRSYTQAELSAAGFWHGEEVVAYPPQALPDAKKESTPDAGLTNRELRK